MINAVGRDIPDYLLVNGKEVYQGKNYKDGQLVKKATPPPPSVTRSLRRTSCALPSGKPARSAVPMTA